MLFHSSSRRASITSTWTLQILRPPKTSPPSLKRNHRRHPGQQEPHPRMQLAFLRATKCRALFEPSGSHLGFGVGWNTDQDSTWPKPAHSGRQLSFCFAERVPSARHELAFLAILIRYQDSSFLRNLTDAC